MQSKAKLFAGAVAGAGLFSAVAYAEPTTEQKLDALTQEVEQLKQQLNVKGGAAPATAAHAHGNKAPGRTHVGGYGEMHYNNWDTGKQELDFHRFVLFFGHNFSDRVRFASELELEHALAGEGKKGEVELEQAYVEMDINDLHAVRAGLMLVPVGMINETHEPPTFYGVERNVVESSVIPTTWWEGGLAIGGQLAPGLRYDAMLSSGLNMAATGANAFNIRSSRQKVSEANADDGALTYRLAWRGVPGLEIGASAFYQDDVTQASGDSAASTSALLLETHASFSKGPFGARALYAEWDFDSEAARTAGKDKQYGWYLEPSLKLTPKLGLFARYAEWDLGGTAASTKQDQTNVGLSFWPVAQVVLKADVQQQGDNGAADGFNLGVGYMF